MSTVGGDPVSNAGIEVAPRDDPNDMDFDIVMGGTYDLSTPESLTTSAWSRSDFSTLRCASVVVGKEDAWVVPVAVTK